MMSETTITKRLHIAGLTPSITSSNLHSRLSSFATVKSLDGFGLKNGLGEPRNFVYATVEGKAKDLSKCVNVLSGTTWKGAKLRLGDARPDYHDRISKEHKDALESPPPKKKRRLSKYSAVESKNMSLVAPDNVAERPGWKVTTTGKLLRPMRMRPGKPLPPMLDSILHSRSTDIVVKRKRKPKPPPTRARRRTIDMTKWGGERLSGVFLGGGVAAIRPAELPTLPAAEPVPRPRRIPSPAVLEPPRLQKDVPVVDEPVDLAKEAQGALSLLQSIFNDDKWTGQAELDSDIEVDQAPARVGNVPLDDADFEVVPMDIDVQSVEVPPDSDDDGEAEVPSPAVLSTGKSSKLKDLFAPRETEAQFSLLGHLDLDLDLDEEVPFLTSAEPVPPAWEDPEVLAVPTQPSQTNQFTLDHKKPFFFPSLGDSNAAYRGARDLFSVQFAPGRFYRTETEEEIKKRWSDTKVDLTQGWKRRCREAGKVSRRRGGAEDLE